MTWLRDRLDLFIWRVRHRSFPFLRPSMRHVLGRLYIGLPGSGKTLFMVRDAVREMRRGGVVVSNIRIRDIVGGHESVPVECWHDVLENLYFHLRDEHPERFVVAVDELHLWSDAREWKETPRWLLETFAERRHLGLSIMGTTQVLEQVEIRLRNLTDETVTVAPDPLRRWFHVLFESDVPLFRVQWLDRLLESGGDTDPYTRSGWMIAPWWAYESYSTLELTTRQTIARERSGLNAEQLLDRIRGLIDVRYGISGDSDSLPVDAEAAAE